MPVTTQRRLPPNPFGKPMISFMDVAGALPGAPRDFMTGQPIPQSMEDIADGAAVERMPQEEPYRSQTTTQGDYEPEELQQMQSVSPLDGGGDDFKSAPQINQRRALANALLQQGQQERQGGWLGGLARLANTVGGSYMGMKAQDEEEAMKAKTSSEWQRIMSSSPDQETLIQNMMKSPVAEIRDRAVEAQLKARMQPKAPSVFKPGTIQGYDDGGFHYTREAQADGTWKVLGKEPIKKTGERAPPSPEKLRAWRIVAQRILSGDPKAMVSVPRGDGGEAYYGIQQMVYDIGSSMTNPKTGKPYTPEDLGRVITNAGIEFSGMAAANRAVRQRSAMVQFSSHAVTSQKELLKNASNQVKRGSFLPWNQFQQAVALNTGDPKIANFRAAINAFTNAYARAVKGGTPTGAEAEHAYNMLSTAFSKGQFEQVLETMLGEMTAEIAGAHQTLQELGDEFQNTRFGAQRAQMIDDVTKILGGDPNAFAIGDENLMPQGGHGAPAAGGHGAPAAGGHGAPAAKPGPQRKQIKDPDNPGKLIWVRKTPNGWEEE
jgi:hypothetical protein